MRSVRFAGIWTLIMGLGAAAWAAEAPPGGTPTALGVSRVAVFSSGVAYFERTASVSGDAAAELKFRTDQINDILKSMVVEDFGGGRVGIIRYASQDPIEKTLRSFGVDLTGKPTLGELLDQLRGEPVEIATLGSAPLSGVIVGVEKSQIVNPDGTVLQEIEQLTVLTDTGLQRIDLKSVQSIKLTNEKVAGELRKALATLATAHDADKKTVVVNFEGQGTRQVRAAYLLEAPIWKTSYRLVLGEEQKQKEAKPFLQGWATVENATEEDWNDVQLSLVSGRPISFRMDLYTPLYVPRPLETLELYASLRPPQFEGGFEERAYAKEMPEVDPRTGRGVQRGLAARSAPAAPAAAGGRAAGRLEMGDALGVPLERMRDLSLEGVGVESVASALEAGELFAYHIANPVSIPRQQSAMLPIVNQAVTADKVSIYNPGTHAKYPLNGLELKNTTGLNLMQGPVTVFDGGTYAGDAKLPDLKPDEKRLVAYALDLATEVLVKQKSHPDEIVSLRIARGTLVHVHRFVDSREYLVKNKDDKPRTVILEQPYSEDWKLVEPKEPYERTSNLLRFKVQVREQETLTQPVRLERVQDQTVALSEIGLDQIRFFLKAPVITPKVKEALEKVIELRTRLEELAQRVQRLEQQRNEQIAEQGRVRENLKTLDKNTDAYKRQLALFDEIDGRIASLGKELEAARQAEDEQRKALQDYLLGLTIE